VNSSIGDCSICCAIAGNCNTRCTESSSGQYGIPSNPNTISQTTTSINTSRTRPACPVSRARTKAHERGGEQRAHRGDAIEPVVERGQGQRPVEGIDAYDRNQVAREHDPRVATGAKCAQEGVRRRLALSARSGDRHAMARDPVTTDIRNPRENPGDACATTQALFDQPDSNQLDSINSIRSARKTSSDRCCRPKRSRRPVPAPLYPSTRRPDRARPRLRRSPASFPPSAASRV